MAHLLADYTWTIQFSADIPECLLWLIFVLAIALLIAPGIFFARHGARARKQEIIESLDDNGASLYFRCFHPHTQIANNADGRDQFIKFYNSEFGMVRFLLPALLCYSTAAILGLLATYIATQWLKFGPTKGQVPLAAVLAILGGYSWVTYDQIMRAMRADLTPRSLFIGAFRLLIAVPLAYSVSQAFNASLEAPAAFLLGMFPTQTVMTVARRALAKVIPSVELPQDVQSEVQKLKSVDVAAAERFGDEGVTSVLQLAYADPVRLAIRTNLGFSFIIGSASEAILWICLQEKTPLLRQFGIAGSFECRTLWLDLINGHNAEAQARAQHIVDAVTQVLALSTPDAFYNVLSQVAQDPYTEFAFAVWANQQRSAFPRSSADGQSPTDQATGIVPPTRTDDASPPPPENNP